MSRKKSEPNAAAWFYGQPGFHATRKPQDIAGGQEKAKHVRSMVAPGYCLACGLNWPCAPAGVQDQERPIAKEYPCWCAQTKAGLATGCPNHPAPPIAKAEEPEQASGEDGPPLRMSLSVLHEQTVALYKAEARVERLEKALRPFATFAAKWDAKPLSGMDDEIYAIHTGTEWAASIRLSDMRKAAAALAESADRGEEKANG